MESGKPLVYTGRCHFVKVVNILSGYGLKDNWVVMGVDDINSKYTKLQMALYADDIIQEHNAS